MPADQAIGIGTDIAILSLLALSAYLVLLVGRISFGQQAYFGLGAYASAMTTTLLGWPLAPALVCGAFVGARLSLIPAFRPAKAAAGSAA
jgi:branched-chain amino acid transport system permease protein